MTKTIYRFYSKAEFKRTGMSYTALTTDDDTYKPSYPYTDTAVPEELQAPDKVPFYVPEHAQWEDMSEDAQIIADKQQAADLATAKQDAKEAKAQATSLQAALDKANSDIELSNQATTELTNLLFIVADQDKLAAAMGMTTDTTTQEATQNA
ncbi:hypothetical protein [Lacticaseibacillus sharpeae]|uniref:Uncharacterized protein n=1 Tax=Lacticaseibacillus sharpeae JCM 1186 = DSM 20505 TaxID=1291052 RepID=A0A0R1ZT08_9LACO|nr:hypothetical protein [Lacticaseibacillus sharpeae]KRM54825.1 hypothetical protein FC18_GL002242 [Lacticaseibacillus sharpeae JCM 1186 = DSM 20505]